MENFFCGTAEAYWQRRRLAVDTQSLGLSPEADKALHRFGSADLFPSYPRFPCDDVRALQTVWKEPNAVGAFSLVLAHGTIVGQLFALAALRDLDPHAYASALPQFRERADPIRFSHHREKVSAAAIIENPDAVRLDGPSDDPWKWSARNPGTPIEYDIVGGGYTAELRPTPSTLVPPSTRPDKCLAVEPAWVFNANVVVRILSVESAGGTPFVAEPVVQTIRNKFPSKQTTGRVLHMTPKQLPEDRFAPPIEETRPITVVHEAERPATHERWILLDGFEARVHYSVAVALEGRYEPLDFSLFTRRFGGYIYLRGSSVGA